MTPRELGSMSAFPSQEQEEACGGRMTEFHPGMSIRLQIAAMAMQGICADGIPGHHHEHAQTARDAFAYADALLAEAVKEQTP